MEVTITLIFHIWKFSGPVSVGHAVVSEADMMCVCAQM